MLKRLFTILLCGLLFQTMLAADAWAIQPAGPAPSPRAAKVRNAVQRLGTGSNSLIAVRLDNKSVVSGSIDTVGADSFDVVDPHTNATTAVRFADVRALAGTNLVSGDNVQYPNGIRAKLAKVAGVLIPGRRPMANKFAGTTLLIIGIVIGILIAVVVAKSV